MKFEPEYTAIVIKSIQRDDDSWVGDLTGKTPAEREDIVKEYFKELFMKFETETRALAEDE